MRRPITILAAGLLTLALLAAGSFASVSLVAAATLASTTTCANSVDNTGGKGLICQVTVTNRITASGGTAKVTVRECHGAAGAPAAACKTTTKNLTKPVKVVNQCNGSINGGGGTLRCSVRVTNVFVGMSANRSGATINQCVGSGGGITTGCDPFPANTTGATITECNGSANGGTLVGLNCTATGTQSSAFGIKINQCNGSGNGGGALVICSAELHNVAVTSSGSSTGGGATLPPTSTLEAGPGSGSSDGLGLLAATLVILFTGGLLASSAWVRRRRA